MTYLTHSQYKLDKSQARGWKTVGLNLSPEHEAALVLKKPLPTMCAMAGACASVCLVKTGMNKFPQHAKVRARKTEQWLKNPKAFISQVDKEIKAAHQSALKSQQKLAVRPNLLSDQPRLAHQLAKLNPGIQFYDYTKLPLPRGRMLDNYHLTYSVSERTTKADLLHCLSRGVNLAVVTSVKKGQPLPKTMKVMGKTLDVVDGDADDLRFLDAEGVVVGLRWKGSNANLAKGIAGGFVIDPTKGLVR